MPSRTRYTPEFKLRGTRGSNTTPYYDDTTTYYTSGYDTVDDVTGPGDNGPLYVEHLHWDGGIINKPADTSESGSWFRNYACTYLLGLNNIQHIDITGLPGVIEVATSAAARTNPSRPYVDVPVSIRELRDLPFDFLQRGRDLFGSTAGANLRVQFGLLPLLNDMKKLTNFQKAYDIRVQQMDRLFGARGLRRTLKYGGYSEVDTYNATTQSIGAFINVPFRRTTRVTIKAHVRWKSTVQMPRDQAVPKEMRRRLFDAMLGMQGNLNIGHLSTLWEALPWSWLIDWCGSVGDFLMAQRNVIPATLDSVRVMRHFQTEVVAPQGSSSNGAIQSRMTGLLDTKRRDAAIIAPLAHFPILSENQVGLLASLLASRRR